MNVESLTLTSIGPIINHTIPLYEIKICPIELTCNDHLVALNDKNERHNDLRDQLPFPPARGRSLCGSSHWFAQQGGPCCEIKRAGMIGQNLRRFFFYVFFEVTDV